MKEQDSRLVDLEVKLLLKQEQEKATKKTIAILAITVLGFLILERF